MKFSAKRIVFILIGFIGLASATYLIAASKKATAIFEGKKTDIVNFYAFQSPVTSSNLVFVVDTQAMLLPTDSDSSTFDLDTMFEINIDNSEEKDAIEDLVIQITFTTAGVQVYGPVAPIQTGLNSTLVSSAKSVQAAVSKYGVIPTVGNSGTIQVFAGPRDNAFFFDRTQFKNIVSGTAPAGFNNPGTDAYKGTNVMSVVIELPKSLLGTDNINAWVTSNHKI